MGLASGLEPRSIFDAMQIKHGLSPFFVGGDPGTQGEKVKQFERAIYPLWAPIFGDEEIADLERYHRADVAIFERRESLRPKRLEMTDSQRRKKIADSESQEIFA